MAAEPGGGHGGATASSKYVPTGVTPLLALPSPTGVFARFPELKEILVGNREFINEANLEAPGEIEELAVEGQHPKVRLRLSSLLAKADQLAVFLPWLL